jgi:hypothetical protein
MLAERQDNISNNSIFWKPPPKYILGQSSATLEIRNEMLSRHPASNPLENVGSSCERWNHFLLPNRPNNQRYLHTLNAGNARYGRLRMRRPGYKWLLGLIRPERKELNFLGRRPSPIRIELLIKNPLADKNCAAGGPLAPSLRFVGSSWCHMISRKILYTTSTTVLLLYYLLYDIHYNRFCRLYT